MFCAIFLIQLNTLSHIWTENKILTLTCCVHRHPSQTKDQSFHGPLYFPYIYCTLLSPCLCVNRWRFTHLQPY